MEYLISLVLAIAFYGLSVLCEKWNFKMLNEFCLGMFIICIGLIIFKFIYTYIIFKPLEIGVGLGLW